jgi:hypothetical protein
MMHGIRAFVAFSLCLGCGRAEQASVSETASQQSPPLPGPTDELTPADAAKIPPFPPRDVAVESKTSSAVITWEPSPLENVVGYRIYRKESETKLIKLGQTVKSSFTIAAPKRGVEYSVTAINGYGAESPHAVAAPKTPK